MKNLYLDEKIKRQIRKASEYTTFQFIVVFSACAVLGGFMGWMGWTIWQKMSAAGEGTSTVFPIALISYRGACVLLAAVPLFFLIAGLVSKLRSGNGGSDNKKKPSTQPSAA